MATKEQYEAFKILFFDKEEQRATSLVDRGKTFISLATLYGAFITFTLEKINNKTILSWSLFSCAVASMLASFLLSIWAIGFLSQYEDVNHPENIIKDLGNAPPTNEDFFDDRIIDLTAACMHNRRYNDQRATLLMWATIFLLLGLFLHGVYFLIKGLPEGRDRVMADDSNTPKDERTERRKVVEGLESYGASMNEKLKLRLDTRFARRNSGLGEIELPLLEPLGLKGSKRKGGRSAR